MKNNHPLSFEDHEDEVNSWQVQYVKIPGEHFNVSYTVALLSVVCVMGICLYGGLISDLST